MELKYIVLTIIKIIVSVPTIVMNNYGVGATAMMGGYLDNKNETDGFVGIPYPTEDVRNKNDRMDHMSGSGLGHQVNKTENIPDPSPLVIPGYNLPETIFNKGKPFYLEKDPVTGKLDFTNKTQSKIDEDFYDYSDEEQSDDIFNKANINRKDNNIGSHRPSDVNQLSPNFHDFLNLPIKYNPDKYVYPLISSSYANTKVQGNVNKFHNHKTVATKFPSKDSYLPSSYYQNDASTTTSTTIRTTSRSTTTAPTTTTTIRNLMSHSISYPQFNEDFSDDYYQDYDKNKNVNDEKITTKKINLTTEPTQKIVATTTAQTTTKKSMSLFEQLFGEYDETVVATERTIQPYITNTSPKSTESSTAKKSISATSTTNYETENSYDEYEDYYYYNNKNGTETPSKSPLNSTQTSTTTLSTTIFNSHSYQETTTKKAATTTRLTTRVTSLPLGDNHLSTPYVAPQTPDPTNYRPIIIATQNLRDQLKNERVVPKPFSISKHAPSTSSIHIAPDQDTVSFVVGHHQSMEATPNNHDDFKTNSFQALYEDGGFVKDDIIYNNNPDQVIFQPPPPQEVSGSAVTIQPQVNSEASLSIGAPVKKIPGQVMDVKLQPESVANGKIVFPSEKEVLLTTVTPMQATPTPNREILQLSSNPMYHQLPSDLTPPKEQEGKYPTRPDSRPPWDPRPGHFFIGKLEYSRPPRPVPDVAYKRIDTLPNILPQFRPNVPHDIQRGPQKLYNRFHREPLLERPSNRPLEFYEKLQPPPPPPNYRQVPKIEQRTHVAQDRKGEEYKKDFVDLNVLEPPKVMTNLKKESGDVIETLQMLQAKQNDKKESNLEVVTSDNTLVQQEVNKTDKPIYVVYPVNTPPIKLDVIDTNKRESVVIGTRAELPLPPSEINVEETKSILEMRDREDSPILKPHSRPPNFGSKSDFPYPLERPDISKLHPVPDATNDLNQPENEGVIVVSNNQWDTIDNIESRIVTGNKIYNNIHTEKPIAVAYTPTEPHIETYRQPEIGDKLDENRPTNHRNEEREEEVNVHAEQDFQAPFQASVKVDSPSQGWSIIRRNDSKPTVDKEDATTISTTSTSEFDIENFKPQLEGGFKPIYNFGNEDAQIEERLE